MYSSIELPKPTDEQVLERAPLELFRCYLNDPNVNTYGRRGQAQQGVDIYGKRDGDSDKPVGIQCKLKSDDKELDEKIIREEVGKALTYEPRLVEYFIISTAPDDAKHQKLARVLEQEIKKASGRDISIQVWGWGTVSREAQRFEAALKAFWPDYTPYSQGLEEGLKELSAGQLELRGEVREIAAGIAHSGSVVMDVGDHQAGDPLEAHLDGEIDTYRDYLTTGQPQTAKSLFDGLLGRLDSSASNRLQFRIKANIAFCLYELGDEESGNNLMLEACDHTPNAPKSVANRALVHLLRGDFEAVATIAMKGLADAPDNEELAGYFVQAMRFDSEIMDPLALLPHGLTKTKHVEIAHLSFLHQRAVAPEWWVKAAEVSKKYPDEKFPTQTHGEAILDRLLTEDKVLNRLQISEQGLKRLEEARNLLLALWDELDFTQAVPQVQQFGLFTNLILACDLLGDVDEVKRLLATCPQVILDDNDVAVRIAQMGFHHDNSGDFKEAIDRITDPAAKFHFEFYAALDESDWNRIVALTKDGIEYAQEYELELVTTVTAIAGLLTFQGDISVSQILETKKHVSHDLRALVLVFDALVEKGFEDEATELFTEIFEAVIQSDDYASRAMLAQRGANRNEWDRVSQLLAGYVDDEKDTKLLRLLATAYVNLTPATKSAVGFYRNLSPGLAQKPYYLEREAVFHFNRGALAQSERCYRAAIDSADRAELGFYLPLLSLLVRRQKLADVATLIEEMLKLDLKGEPIEHMGFAQFLMKHQHYKQAMSVAYAALHDDPHDAAIHSAYCGLVLMNTRTGSNADIIPVMDEIAQDCWFEIRNDEGERHEFLVSNEPQAEPQHLFKMVTGTDHNLVKKCLGMKVGEQFEHSDGMALQTSNWAIVGLKHKYAQASYIIMNEFDVRFPNSGLMGKMTMVGDDVEPVLKHIRDHAEQRKKVSEYYTDQGFPINVLAAMQGTSSIEYAGYLRDLGSDIQACRGLLEERLTALDAISKKRLEGVTIDALTAWTMHWANAFDVVQKVFGEVRIAQSCIDEITKLVVDAEESSGGKMSIGWKDGRFLRDEVSEEEVYDFHKKISAVRDDIVNRCAVVPSEAPDVIPEISRTLIDNFSSDLLDPAFCAAKGGLFLSEDLFYRQMVEAEYDVTGIWLQSVYMFALNEKLIEFAEYCDLCVALASGKHGHLTVNAHLLVSVGLRHGEDDSQKFEVLANAIGIRNADISSHFEVASTTIRQLWKARGIPKATKHKLVGAMISKLIRHRPKDWHHLLAMLFVMMGTQFRTFLNGWMAGHFLPKEKFDEGFADIIRIVIPKR